MEKLLDRKEKLEKLLSTREVADWLGFSMKHVTNMCERGTIPFYKITGRYKFKEKELLKWIKEKKVSNG